MQESRLVDAGEQIPPLIDVNGMRIGLMTCYDLRFPELALSLALKGGRCVGASYRVGSRAIERTSLGNAAGGTRAGYHLLCRCCRRMRNEEHRAKQGSRSAGVTIAAAAEAPDLLVAEINIDRIALARQQLPVLRNRRFAPPQLL